MKCPCCGSEMEPGGIVTGGVTAMWHPAREFDKQKWKRVVYTDGKAIGSSSVLLSQTRIPDAWYCPNCDIVSGIFKVTNGN